MMRKFIFVLAVLGIAIACMAAIPWRFEYGVSDSMDRFMRDPSFRQLRTTGDVTIDDDLTNSPALYFIDAGENDWAFLKVNGATGNLTATSDAATSDFQIVTGNLKVGGGTEGTTLNGQDAYVTGTFEVDGAVALDNSSLSIRAISYTWPADNGDAGEQLQTDGSGTLSWESAGAGSGRSLDEAYDDGGSGEGDKINADSNAVEIEVAAQANNGALILDCDDTNNLSVLLITNVGTSSSTVSIDVDGQAAGRDYEGTGASSYIEGDGSIVGLDLDVTGALGITLQNDAAILNDTDNEVQIGDGSEDVSFGFGTNNTLTMTTDSDVATVAWGDLDAFTGLNTVAFDQAASSISLAANGAGDNLTIQVTGTQDSHLQLTSAGTSADAIRINASDGGLDLDAADGIAIDTAGGSGEDIVVTNTGGSITLEATEGDQAAIVLNASTAAGGIDITSNADIDITTTGSGTEDISITNTGGSIFVEATEASATAIKLDASDSAGGITVDYGTGNMVVTGTGASADFTLDADLISIDGKGASNISFANGANEDVTISTTGSADHSLIISATGTNTDAMQISTSAGGMDITVAGAASGEDLDLASNTAINLTSSENQDLAINIATSDASGQIQITSTDTTVDALEIDASAGGIDIDGADDIDIQVNSGGAGEDLLLTQSGSQDAHVTITSAGTSANAIGIQVDGTGGGIDMDTDGGAISITADGDGTGTITVDANDTLTLVSTSLADDGIYIHANGGASEGIKIHSDQGTGAASVEVLSDAGGITMTADAASGVGMITLPSLICLGTAGSLANDGTPDVSGSSFWETGGTTTITGFDTGGGSITEGTVLIIKVKHSLTIDVTSSNLTGGTTDLSAADGDTLLFIYDGESKFTLISFMDMSDDLS